ncbi:coenzyme F420-0:L-glutamate ligase [Methanoculleus sp. Wushi-C6]|uniref:Coenzyme F420-0:L-glutamate ligase n=1 Tax=Methanoculleus caldifontis TaxID=2651577 RepID=A0ABU3WX81_9EURY|nr:coenzyme F420-0:L-glutamate ligase [Methanoculleus sp. Wushi-C6]MDV2480420.1 coenzyme F420-0:L-glutamate ligase [Methanoculleus sp. Wushi-C6]
MTPPSFSVYGLATPLIHAGDDVAAHLFEAAGRSECRGLRDGDIVVVAESPVATAEGRAVRLAGIEPSAEALRLAEEYRMDPRVAEVVLRESDRVVGGIPGFLLCMKGGTLLPNAGIDASNTPEGFVLPLPADPDASAARIRAALRERSGADVGVIVIDSRTHAMRLGCSGVAIGCSGIPSVVDERGKRDLFGRELEVTKRAVADCIASAAELVMGEAGECVPAALVRGVGLPIGDDYAGVATIDASECLFMGVALHTDPALLVDEERDSQAL